jgi:hypothetical protein
MHSAFLAIDVEGNVWTLGANETLVSWARLPLQGVEETDKVVLSAASPFRASFVLASGKVVFYMVDAECCCA